jgi:hypothetical protein
MLLSGSGGMYSPLMERNIVPYQVARKQSLRRLDDRSGTASGSVHTNLCLGINTRMVKSDEAPSYEAS